MPEDLFLASFSCRHRFNYSLFGAAVLPPVLAEA